MKSKLTQTQRAEIIQRYEAGERTVALARAYGVTPGSIGPLLRRAGVAIRKPKTSLRFSEAELAEARRLYTEGLDGPKIATRLGMSTGTVYRALRLGGIDPSDPPTEGEWVEAKMRYRAGESLEGIAASLGYGYGKIRAGLIKRGAPIRSNHEHLRKYHCDTSYFDAINSEPKAYWLGFITADGCITDSRRHSLQIKLKGGDHDHLLRLKSALKADNPVATTRAGQAHLTIFSNHLIAGLAAHGVAPRKSLTTEWPRTVPDHLLRHYLRGYSDGDGCFSISKVDQANWSLCGTEPFLKDCQHFLAQVVRFSPTKLRMNGAIHVFAYGGNRQITRLARLLYNDATVWLPRKRDKIAHLL